MHKKRRNKLVIGLIGIPFVVFLIFLGLRYKYSPPFKYEEPPSNLVGTIWKSSNVCLIVTDKHFIAINQQIDYLASVGIDNYYSFLNPVFHDQHNWSQKDINKMFYGYFSGNRNLYFYQLNDEVYGTTFVYYQFTANNKMIVGIPIILKI